MAARKNPACTWAKQRLANQRFNKHLDACIDSCINVMVPSNTFNVLQYIYNVQIPLKYYHLVNALSYSSSFANPVLYALRIPEVREALVLCCFGRQTATPGMKDVKRKYGKTLALTNLTTLGIETSHGQQTLEQEVIDTKL